MDLLVYAWEMEVRNDCSITDHISGSRKDTNMGHEIAEKEPLKYITASLFPHNCTLPE